MENKIINEKLNLIKKCVESYQIIPDNVAIMLMEQITNILFTIHVCGEEQRKFLDEIEKAFPVVYKYNNELVLFGWDNEDLDNIILKPKQYYMKVTGLNMGKVIKGE